MGIKIRLDAATYLDRGHAGPGFDQGFFCFIRYSTQLLLIRKKRQNRFSLKQIPAFAVAQSSKRKAMLIQQHPGHNRLYETK